jgi:hypothetical protein
MLATIPWPPRGRDRSLPGPNQTNTESERPVVRRQAAETRRTRSIHLPRGDQPQGQVTTRSTAHGADLGEGCSAHRSALADYGSDGWGFDSLPARFRR